MSAYGCDRAHSAPDQTAQACSGSLGLPRPNAEPGDRRRGDRRRSAGHGRAGALCVAKGAIPRPLRKYALDLDTDVIERIRRQIRRRKRIVAHWAYRGPMPSPVTAGAVTAGAAPVTAVPARCVLLKAQSLALCANMPWIWISNVGVRM